MRLAIGTLMVWGWLAAAQTAATNLMQFLVLLAASIAACGIIWVKVVRPAVRLSSAIYEAVEHVRELPEFRKEVSARLAVIEGALYGTDMMGHPPTRRRDDPPY